MIGTTAARVTIGALFAGHGLLEWYFGFSR